MKLKMFCVYDMKIAVYLRPFFELNEITASRALCMAMNDKTVQLSHFPEDFSLYFMGTWDDVTGKYEEEVPPKFIIAAISLVKREMEEENGAEKEDRDKNPVARDHVLRRLEDATTFCAGGGHK